MENKINYQEQYEINLKKLKVWRTIGIVFIILFLCILSVGIWGYNMEVAEEKKIYTCYYDICGGYPDAKFDASMNVCFCYDYDLLGNLDIVETEYIG